MTKKLYVRFEAGQTCPCGRTRAGQFMAAITKGQILDPLICQYCRKPVVAEMVGFTYIKEEKQND
jgi:hypothetical protein